MLVDATRKRPMAPLALPTREHMEHARMGLGAVGVAEGGDLGATWSTRGSCGNGSACTRSP